MYEDSPCAPPLYGISCNWRDLDVGTRQAYTPLVTYFNAAYVPGASLFTHVMTCKTIEFRNLTLIARNADDMARALLVHTGQALMRVEPRTTPKSEKAF